jgi:hypothetical protein
LNIDIELPDEFAEVESELRLSRGLHVTAAVFVLYVSLTVSLTVTIVTVIVATVITATAAVCVHVTAAVVTKILCSSSPHIESTSSTEIEIHIIVVVADATATTTSFTTFSAAAAYFSSYSSNIVTVTTVIPNITVDIAVTAYLCCRSCRCRSQFADSASAVYQLSTPYNASRVTAVVATHILIGCVRL